MKKLSSLLVSLTMALLVASSAQAGHQSDKCVVGIVLDTSPTSNWSQLSKAAENIFKSAGVRDTVLLFEVRGLHMHLKFSCIKRCTDRELASFYSALRTSSSDWFINADLARALNGPIYEKLLQHTDQEGHAVIIALTEGNLSRQQASEICEFADHVKAAHGWPLLVTGTLEKINRELLIAVGKGRLHWCKLADAADRALMEKLIQKIRSGTAIAAGRITAAQPSVTTDQEATDSEKDTSAKSKTAEKLSPTIQLPRTVAEPNSVGAAPPVRPAKESRVSKDVSGKQNRRAQSAQRTEYI
jgi:hypothetical protein